MYKILKRQINNNLETIFFFTKQNISTLTSVPKCTKYTVMNLNIVYDYTPIYK